MQQQVDKQQQTSFLQQYWNTRSKNHMEHHHIFVTVLACLMLSSRSAAQSGDCNSQDSDQLRELRLEQLRHNIRAQLGITNITEPPEGVDYPTEKDLDPELLRSYERIADVEASSRCTTDDFYAKPINSFIGHFAEGNFGDQ